MARRRGARPLSDPRIWDALRIHPTRDAEQLLRIFERLSARFPHLTVQEAEQLADSIYDLKTILGAEVTVRDLLSDED